MFENILGTLSCPDCNRKLKPKIIIKKAGKRIIHASVSCKCDLYPILDGILFLKKDKATRLALKFLNQNREFLKKEIGLPLFFLRHPSKLSYYLLSMFSRIKIFKYLTFPFFVFIFKSAGVYEKSWAEYIAQRGNSIQFLCAKIFSGMVKKDATTVDIGCGAGQLLSLLKTKTYQSNLVGVDSSLPGLYISRKYMAQSANLIYLDLERPLPFNVRFFNDIFVNDVFHYIKNKKRLGNNLGNLIKTSGIIFLNNLHNKDKNMEFNDPVHYPETPKGYSSFFPKLKAVVYSEEIANQGLLKRVGPDKAKSLKTFSLLVSQNPPKDDIYLAPQSESKHAKGVLVS